MVLRDKFSCRSIFPAVLLLLLGFSVLFLGHEMVDLQSLTSLGSITTRETASGLPHSADWKTVLQESDLLSVQAAFGRYKAYEEEGDEGRWRFRGLGYLFVEHNMILEASLVETNVVRIENVLSAPRTSHCDLLTLWVRVNGPEIFAGKPKAMDNGSDCWWEFPFSISKHGQYEIEVKLLTWNGRASIVGHPSNTDTKFTSVQCPVESGMADNSKNNNTRSSIRAFKLYEPVHGCCEFCTRQRPYCIAWATPPSDLNASVFNNGCEFTYADDAPTIPKSKHIGAAERRRRLGGVPQVHGTPHDNDLVSYFMGCGWSAWFTLDIPCLSGDLDDRVYVAEPTFVYPPEGEEDNVALRRLEATDTTEQPQQQQLPLCTMEHEQFSTPSSSPSGRWVRRDFPSATECPEPMQVDAPFSSKFSIMQFDPERPTCWHRDNFSIVGKQCIEMNCRLIPPSSTWYSNVHNESAAYVVWKPYACDYIELTDTELQTCITTLQIGKLERNGRSVADFLDQYLQQRLQHMEMVPDGKTVTLSTLAMLHKIGQPDADFLTMEPLLDPLLSDKNTDTNVYWMSGYFLASERAVHGHVDRMDWANRKVMEAYPHSKMLNAFDMSAAFTFDTATQMDGMHIIGPPMKMVITKFFHHLCKDVVPTAGRVGEGW